MAGDTPELVPFSPFWTERFQGGSLILDRNLAAIKAAIDRANATIIRQQNIINQLVLSVSIAIGTTSTPVPPGFDGGEMGDVFGDMAMSVPGRDGVIGRDGRPGFGMDGNDGDDGLPGPPGIGTPGAAGSAGAPGAAGPPSYLFHDDAEEGQPGPPGRNGTLAATGAAGFLRLTQTAALFTTYANGYNKVIDASGGDASFFNPTLNVDETYVVIGPFTTSDGDSLSIPDGASMAII